MLLTGVAFLNQNDESIMVNRRFRELMTCCSARSFDCWSKPIHPEDYDRVATAYLETSRSKHDLRIEFRTRSQISLWRVLMLAPLDDIDLHRLSLSGGGFSALLQTLPKRRRLSRCKPKPPEKRKGS
ncbi:hypothetical protein PITC_095090 [Penicillium italicum]|uniref:PAS fold-3 n=1 Tax=Penicillium italicum TaxID=40296 RepID=A0A0A2KNB2_PENIT|nr:hypothetical protein PITC_095090 [Penicillium italicum]